MTDKFQLRKAYRAIRSHIPATIRAEASQKAAAIFKAQSIFKMSENIACYLPFKDECDPTPIIETIWHAKKNCYLPVLTKDEKSLIFVHYHYGDALHLNRFSILEPINISQTIAPQDLDVTITPLIAFDKKGHRLGTGGGYYDRTFAFLSSGEFSKPHMIGLAYQAQEVKEIPSDPWDITLEAVITEQTYLHCKS